MNERDIIAADYQRHVIDAVRVEPDAIVITYASKIFGGIMPELLAAGVADAIRPGAEIYVRTHTVETGWPGQVAHMILRWNGPEEWAELYSNM
ncbi:MAG: hypothetical protein ACKVS9_09045 [Phycisphaerae bacterium]